MENKKHPQYDLQRHRGLFFQIGLLFALILVNAAFEWRVEEHVPAKVRLADIEQISEELEAIERAATLKRPKAPANAHEEEEILIKVEFLFDEE